MEFIHAKTMLTKTKQSNFNWFGTDYNMNIYRGCCHGCIYCDSRSECYHVDDFDRVRAKANSGNILEGEMARKKKTGVIGTGAMSDPYNPCEREYGLTRQALEVIDHHGFGVAIATKSDLIARDIDVLNRIQRHSPVLIKMTLTTVDDELARKVEPHAPLPSERLKALKAISDAGLFAGVLMMPILPFIEDRPEQIKAIIERAAESGVKFIYPGLGVTLRQNQRTYYYQALDDEFPGIKERYERTFGETYSCGSPNGKTLYQIIKQECDARGILYRMEDIIKAYKAGYGEQQLSFL